MYVQTRKKISFYAKKKFVGDLDFYSWKTRARAPIGVRACVRQTT